MSGVQTKTAFGRIFPPRPDWLAKAPPEAIIDPALPIVDTHHHLWQRQSAGGGESWEVPAFRYLLPEFLADCATGHNIVGSVFLQCHSMYRKDGPEPMKPVGETEFVAGVAAMSDSGGYGATKVCAGIVGYADLTAGDWVTPMLEAQIRAGGGRFRGVRHSAGYDADPVIGNSAPGIQPGSYLRDDFRAGLKRLSALGLSLDAWGFHPQIPDMTALARAFPYANIVMGHCGGPLGYGRHAGKRDEVFAEWKRSVGGTRTLSQRHDENRRHDDAAGGVRLPGVGGSAVIGTTGGGVAAVYRDVHRIVRRGSLHGGKQFPGREDGDRFRGAVQRAEADRFGMLGTGEGGDLRGDRAARVSAGLLRRGVGHQLS